MATNVERKYFPLSYKRFITKPPRNEWAIKAHPRSLLESASRSEAGGRRALDKVTWETRELTQNLIKTVTEVSSSGGAQHSPGRRQPLSVLCFWDPTTDTGIKCVPKPLKCRQQENRSGMKMKITFLGMTFPMGTSWVLWGAIWAETVNSESLPRCVFTLHCSWPQRLVWKHRCGCVARLIHSTGPALFLCGSPLTSSSSKYQSFLPFSLPLGILLLNKRRAAPASFKNKHCFVSGYYFKINLETQDSISNISQNGLPPTKNCPHSADHPALLSCDR